jgi:cyclopropane-fatty-acyl-phospholipid synthase
MSAAALYPGRVMHARLGAVEHRFDYPVWYLAVDLDALPALARSSWLFGYNRPALFSLWDADYLDGEGSLRSRVDRHLAARGLRAARVTLLTVPRFMGWVFNPVSFYYAYGEDGRLLAALAEVNNTFSEKHLYLLDHLSIGDDGTARGLAAKDFHVSPFYDRRGDYAFRFAPLGAGMDIGIDIRREDGVAFVSRLQGSLQPFSDAGLIKVLIQRPLAALLTYPRILWQAALLHYRKRLPVYTKPYADSAMTLRREPAGLWRGLQRDIVFRYFAKLKRGRLSLTLPDGSEHGFGGALPGVDARLNVGNWGFFRRVILGGDIGLGESYQEGEWGSPDLALLLRFFAQNLGEADDRGSLLLDRLGRGLAALKHRLRANTLTGSRRNIQAHYDLSNDLYAKFLDGTWMYSCPVYQDLDQAAAEDLSEAQRRKISRLLQPLRLKPGQELLEIGSGWGELAITAARDYGVRVTSLTLSDEQLKLARQRAQAAGVGDRITFVIRDYRQERGLYDAVVSCEMLEAVGHENLPAYFGVLDRCLKPGGRASLQVITMPDHKYEAYLRGTDWIQKHIFPGAVCPSLAAITTAMGRGSRLMVAQAQDIGPHYAPTLARWRQAFLGQADAIRALGFNDKLIRTWDYYFSYCEAGFKQRLLGDQQLVLERAGDDL